jgi:hypothetical protein
MALPNVSGEIITKGSDCQLRVGTNPSDARVIALVARVQFTEDFQVQEAVCIGNLGPVAIDPQGYTCNITMDGFLPYKGKIGGEELQHEGADKRAIMDLVPSRAQIMETGNFKSKIAYMDFKNKKSGAILAKFRGVIITNNGVNVDGNAYARNNVQARALEWDKEAIDNTRAS